MNSNQEQLFIFAGEASGDLHGSRLMAALKKELPQASFIGVGGPKMRAEGVECLLRMEDFEVMGFSAVLMALPKLIRYFYRVRQHILEANPKGVILIDYPGFNLRLAKSLRKQGYKGKIVHYICPSVWAHGKGRIQQLAETIDLLLVIYPFEVECFAHTPLSVKYVGNPLQEAIRSYSIPDNQILKDYGLEPDHAQNTESKALIALFPGSRLSEIKRNLPLQLAAAKLFLTDHPETRFAISCAHDKGDSLIHELVSAFEFTKNQITFVPKAHTYALMRACRSAVAKSGTVTLELALHEKPTVVVYQLSLLNWLIAKYLLRLSLPHYCIVNILGKKAIFPELIERQNTPKEVCEQLNQLNREGAPRDTCISECRKIATLLYRENSSAQAARAIRDLLTQ